MHRAAALVLARSADDVPRTLLALEQAISRHGIARDVVEVKRSRDGLDLTFAKAQHLVDRDGRYREIFQYEFQMSRCVSVIERG